MGGVGMQNRKSEILEKKNGQKSIISHQIYSYVKLFPGQETLVSESIIRV